MADTYRTCNLLCDEHANCLHNNVRMFVCGTYTIVIVVCTLFY